MPRMQLLTGLLLTPILWCIMGCINTPLDPAQLSPDALAETPDHRLCEAYSRNRSPKLQAELERRGTFTELEWRAIKGRTVLMGMSEMALMTALPGITRTRTLRRNGVVTKEWYSARLKDVEVRTQNGKVVWFR